MLILAKPPNVEGHSFALRGSLSYMPLKSEGPVKPDS